MIIGFVVALGVGASAKAPKQGGGQQDAKRAIAIDSARSNPAVPPPINPPVQDQGCDQGEDDRKSDLCAQWRSVDAARSSANAAWTMGAIGALIGFLTLLAAMSAARWAKRAAINAGHSATIANDALIADTRAWLAIKWVTSHVVGDPPADEAETVRSRISIGVHNYGRGPALDCKARVGWKRRGEIWEALDEAPYCRSASFDALMPGESDETILVLLDDPFDEIYFNGMMMLWVELSYRVVGTEGFRTTIQHLKVAGAKTGGGHVAVGKGFIVRGHRLLALPEKTSMT
ncbi:hypothetical protein [Brevundimonas sp. Root1423]|uniref:hypothetical protein n=1 Tax=Brevundimonas sp. Root1423 TaxID=1736462 RepID=UPI0012E3DA1F|nr:hypothetical protein [Brevundimonas sp. Root1423]